MGQKQSQLRNEYAQEFEEIKLSAEETFALVKKRQKKELFIAKKLDLVDFNIKIERGAWDREIVLGYIHKLMNMKCTFELD